MSSASQTLLPTSGILDQETEKLPDLNQGAYQDALPENRTEVNPADSVRPADDARLKAGKEIGIACIYEDLELNHREDSYIALKDLECLFESLGLSTRSQIGNVPKNETRKTFSDLAFDKSQRHVSVFVILAGMDMPNDPLTHATTLDDVLGVLQAKCNENSPKLLIFCRQKDSEDPVQTMGTENEIMDEKDPLKEEDWIKRHPNVALVYKCEDENNIYCFLKDLKEKIEQDSDIPGNSAPVQRIFESLKPNNTKKGFRHRGLTTHADLRIEALKFEDRLLKNHVEFKNLPEFSMIKGADIDCCYKNEGDGRVLIISNEKFAKEPRRRGTRIDCENLEHLFHRLGFSRDRIDVLHDLPSHSMREAVKKFCEEETHGSCAVLVILTHGSKGRLYGTEEPTKDSPNSYISDKEVIDALSTAPWLSKKPKLLLINSCRDVASAPEAPKETGTDCARISESKKSFAQHYTASSLATIADHSPSRAGLIIGYSTLPGERCSGLPYSGSRFITTLCWVFHQHAGREDVLSMINRVNDHITGYKQTGSNPKSGQPEETPMQLPSWIVETTKKFFLVKVDSVAARPPADFIDLKCVLADLGCSFDAQNTDELAVHYQTDDANHRQLCSDFKRELVSLRSDLTEAKKENDHLRERFDQLSAKLDKFRED